MPDEIDPSPEELLMGKLKAMQSDPRARAMDISLSAERIPIPTYRFDQITEMEYGPINCVTVTHRAKGRYSLTSGQRQT